MDRPEDQDENRWRGAGDRIETLLEASSSGGPIARERAEDLVREVSDLYGAGLQHILGLVDDQTVERLVRDDLVASLLLVHNLHPHDVYTRVQTALESVRPYLGSHGGDVTLLGVDDGVVRLEFGGSCTTCPSSSVTLEFAVEDAVRAAAPEVDSIEVVAAEQQSSAAVIPADSLFTRVHSHPGSWVAVPEVAELGPGEIGGFAVGELVILACRVGDTLYAYRDWCPTCENSLAGAILHRSPDRTVLLRCPTCRSLFDVVHAGAEAGDGTAHLDPLPLLDRDGVLSVAVPAEVRG
nr:NifU family protein [Aldersonia kunmingensis]